MLVEHGLADACAFGDLIHRGGVVPLGYEHLKRRVQQLPSSFMPRQPVAAWPGIGRCSQNSISGWLRAAAFPRSPHPKLPSAVVVIVEADGACLFCRIRLIDVERDFVPYSGHGLVRDHFLSLLDGVVFGRLYV